MDDVLVITTNLQVGSRLRNGKIERDDDTIREDLENKTSRDEITMRVLRDAANNVLKFLEFTSEVAQGKNSPVTCLDSKLYFGKLERQPKWFNHSKNGETAPGSREEVGNTFMGVGYSFYKKPVSNPITLRKISAMPNSVKLATFSSEVIRRLKKTSVYEPQA